ITNRSPKIYMESDQWTIRTKDGQPAVHFEHQIAITKKGTEVLSTYEFVEEVLKEKGNLI
ncbi:MAG: type I methionyl aminopeptidase, partial [Bacteroidales bacterium]|nr:type I methionyl aminopeptidase [Bacteroidales bacterium]